MTVQSRNRAERPAGIGIEGAGIVAAIGPDVTGIAIGDRVMVSTSMHPEGGTWAEIAIAEQGGIKPIPADLDFTTAAGSVFLSLSESAR